MKKVALYCIFALMVIIVQLLFVSYCLRNVKFSVLVRAHEQVYTEYSDKIMGFGGAVVNRTIFPVKVVNIEPIDGRGIEYVTTAITEWGFSEIEKEELFKKESLEDKLLRPFSEYSIGCFYKFTGEYMVNPDIYEITYSIFGLKFKKIEGINDN